MFRVLKLTATFKDSSFSFDGDATVAELSTLFSTYVSAQGSAEAEAVKLEEQVEKLESQTNALAAAVTANTPPVVE